MENNQVIQVTNQEEELVATLKPMTADVMILEIQPIKYSDYDYKRLKAVFDQVTRLAPMPVVAVPNGVEIIGLHDFDFTIALKLLQSGKRVQREGWDGYLYMYDGVIYHSSDNKEWKPTQKAILSKNWRIV